jgi:hypothetical protein
MPRWIRIEHEWTFWVDADSFEFCRAEKRAPINSIVIVKNKETPKKRPSYVNTSYGIVGKLGLIRINKKTACEILSNRAMDYIQKTGHWPPCMNLKRVLESGDVELSFTLTEHDSFTLRITADMTDGDPLDFLLGLKQYEKPKTPHREPLQPVRV